MKKIKYVYLQKGMDSLISLDDFGNYLYKKILTYGRVVLNVHYLFEKVIVL